MNDDIRKKLDEELNKNIELPETLSAENIEKLIYEKGSVIDMRVPKKRKGKTVAKAFASIAAVIVVVISVGLIADTANRNIKINKIENYVEADKSASGNSDYSKIEAAVLDRFSEYYKNNIKENDYGISAIFGASSSNKAHYETDADPGEGLLGSGAANGAVSDTLPTESANGGHSTTNTQVEGVDEGDVIKTDGDYIYYVKDDKVIIVSVKDPSKLAVSANIAYEKKDSAYIRDIYLYGNKLTVVFIEYDKPRDTVLFNGMHGYSTACDYAYYSQGHTIIKIYDVADKNNTKELYSFKVSGNYATGRIVNGKLIAITNYNIPYYECVGYKDFDEAASAIKSVSVPTYSINGGDEIRVDADKIHFPDKDSIEEYIIMSMIDLDDLSKHYVSASFGNGYEIYCNTKNLYLTSNRFVKSEVEGGNSAVDVFVAEKTIIDKFEITNEGFKYKATGSAEGFPINQFSMDEYNGNFRIATNGWIDRYDGGYNATTVTVFDENMKPLGGIGNIARTEQLESVRFMGDTLYLVTFYQTDPLFVVDLSDPKNPKIDGELKIPGFSSYLHPIGNGLVIGIGRDGNDDGVNGNAKISLFDVNNGKDPKEVDKFVIPDAYIDSDHKSFVIIDKDTFAVSVRKYAYDAQNGYGETHNITVFSIKDGKIEKVAVYDEFNNDENAYMGVRGVFSGNYFYTVNYSGVIAYDMRTNKKAGELKF